MEDQTPTEPLFRPNKRRKVFRKRAELEEEDELNCDDEPNVDQLTPMEEDPTPIVRSQKRVGGKKHGIAFTSSGARREDLSSEDMATALVRVEQDGEQEAMSGDRFVRPTGKVAVTEDKHMTAFIDSKMAEARSVTSIANAAITLTPEEFSERAQQNGGTQLRSDSQTLATKTAGDWTLDGANARSTRVYQRPTRRRKPKERDEADIAREAMIDQIMRETQVPLYEQPVKSAPSGGDEDGDNDAAAAEAFKEQLLMEMETNRRRPKKAAKDPKDPTAPKGPKLGGSRAQRERMKALEEAKGGSAKK